MLEMAKYPVTQFLQQDPEDHKHHLGRVISNPPPDPTRVRVAQHHDGTAEGEHEPTKSDHKHKTSDPIVRLVVRRGSPTWNQTEKNIGCHENQYPPPLNPFG